MGVYSKPVLETFGGELGFDTPTNYVQMIMDIEEQNHKLFEAVIQLDFAEAYNKAGLNSLTESDIDVIHEAETKKFKEKVKEIIGKIKKWLYDFFGNIFRSIQNLVMNDKKIKEKYDLAKMDSDRKKKFDSSEKEINVIDIKKLKEATNGMVEAITELAKFIEEVGDDKITSLDEQGFKDIMNIVAGRLEKVKMSDVVVKSKIKEISSDNLDFIISQVNTGYKKSIDAYKDGKRDLEKLVEKAEAATNKISESTDPEAVKFASRLSKSVAEASTMITKISNYLFAIQKQVIAVSRTAYLHIGNVVGPLPGKESAEEPKGTEEKKEEPKNESAEYQAAYDLLIEMVSEEYMDAIFA